MEMVKMQVESDGVAVVAICNAPVNALVLQGLAELRNKYMEAMERDDVKAIILTGDGGKFSGGLDINVMRTMQKTGEVSIVANISRDLVNVIEDGKKPSVAAVQGYALGGGLELAMACSARIATPEAKLGLPELTFGVIPGCGGTQRLPRLAGVSKAVSMLMSSESIMSKEGKEIGLIDEVVSTEELLRVSRVWALDIAEGRKCRTNSLSKTDKLASHSDPYALFNTQTAMPHHKACLDAIRYGIVSGGYHGLFKEEELFQELVLSNTAKAFVHFYFAQRAISEAAGITDVGLRPRKMKKVGVIGGGLMGSCIATALILSDINVILKEINTEHLEKAITKIQANLEGLLRKGKLGHDRVVKSLSILKGVSEDYSDFKDLDMVIEAVYEDLSLKQSVFEQVEKNCPDHCILASTTSSIDLNIIGNKTKSQHRIVGAHFFSPAHIMRLLEIIPTEKTSAQVVVDVIAIGKELKKVPVVVKNCPAFAVNRSFFPYTQAAYFLVDLGIDIFRIEKAITTFGMPMGPFQFHDVTGYGVALAANKEIDKAFPDRTYISPLLDLMVSSGRKGKGNGKGYYIYEKKGQPPIPDLSVLPIVQESRRKMNIIPQGQCVTLSDQEIVEMVFFPVVNEACRVIDEGVVAKASGLDVASVLGMKFPSHLGGIMFWGDMIGPKYIHQSLSKWEKMYGGFFKPSNYLAGRAERGMLLNDPAPSP